MSLRVAQALKGAEPRVLTVHVPGGELPDGSHVVVPGMPALGAGRSWVVFTDVWGAVIGGCQGALEVRGGRVAATGEPVEALGRRVRAAARGAGGAEVRERARGARPQAAAPRRRR